MAYVKTTNNAIDQYPYTIGQLRKDNRNVSFPKNITSDILESFGVYAVISEDQPNYDERTQNIAQNDTPSLSDGAWTLGWTVTNKTSEEQAEFDTATASGNRNIRDEKLTETDWWASSDLTMTAEQTAYRQALRDITSHANWPHLEDADWPTKPS